MATLAQAEAAVQAKKVGRKDPEVGRKEAAMAVAVVQAVGRVRSTV